MTRFSLAVPVFGERDGECGNTSLKSVSWFQGHRYSARYLGVVAHLTDDGIEHGNLVRAARRTGATVTFGQGGTIARLRAALRRGLPPIVGWWSKDPGDPDFNPRWSLAERRKNDCGHFSVVCGVDGKRIELMDPQWEERRGRLRVVGRRWMRLRDFQRVWYDTDTKRYRLVRRWYMIAAY
jgi:hypothetical protein